MANRVFLAGRFQSFRTFFESQTTFQLAHFNGCMVGGESFKPWTVASTDDCLVRSLRTKTCDHSHKHVHLCGSKTPKSAFYPMRNVRRYHLIIVSRNCITSSFLVWVASQSLKIQCMFPKEVELEGHSHWAFMSWLIGRSGRTTIFQHSVKPKKEAQGLIDAGTWATRMWSLGTSLNARQGKVEQR